MKLKEVMKLIEADGWEFKRTKGSHMIYKKRGAREIITLVNHGMNKDVPRGLLGQVMRIYEKYKTIK